MRTLYRRHSMPLQKHNTILFYNFKHFSLSMWIAKRNLDQGMLKYICNIYWKINKNKRMCSHVLIYRFIWVPLPGLFECVCSPGQLIGPRGHHVSPAAAAAAPQLPSSAVSSCPPRGCPLLYAFLPGQQLDSADAPAAGLEGQLCSADRPMLQVDPGEERSSWSVWLNASSVPKDSTNAGIFKQYMGALEPSRNRVVVMARQATEAGGIDSLESILGLLKSLKIRALCTQLALISILARVVAILFCTLFTTQGIPELKFFAISWGGGRGVELGGGGVICTSVRAEIQRTLCMRQSFSVSAFSNRWEKIRHFLSMFLILWYPYGCLSLQTVSLTGKICILNFVSDHIKFSIFFKHLGEIKLLKTLHRRPRYRLKCWTKRKLKILRFSTFKY